MGEAAEKLAIPPLPDGEPLDAPGPVPPPVPETAKGPDPGKPRKKGKAKGKTAPKLPRLGKKRPPKLKRPKVPLRQRLSIVTLLLMAAVGSILLAGGVAGIYALSIVYKEKLTDTWAILFLELESHGNRLVQKIESFHGERLSGGQPPDEVLRILAADRLETVRGSFPAQLSPSELKLPSARLEERWTLLKFAGQEYLAVGAGAGAVSRVLREEVGTGSYLMLWKVEVSSWFRDTAKGTDINTLYTITKQGRLLFTNAPDITETNYVQRPLVQKFIANPLNQGQLEFDSEAGAAYGFFYEVPNTNVVLFVETLKSVAMAPVRDIALHYAIVLIFIIGMAGVLLQFPLSSLLAPIKELVRLAAEIGDGNFNARPKQQGFGELSVLSTSFTEMAKSLLVRDEKINLLLIEQQEKLRMVNELAIATSIQNNFLMRESLPPEAGVEVATQYLPAAEVAGDWYGYFHNPANGETVFAIADVSGHGAGSAMFTAIIAAAFEDARARSLEDGAFAMDDFVKRLNRLIFQLGQAKFHATLLMARHRRGSGTIELLNAGHTFPVLIPTAETGESANFIVMRSDMLGLSLDFFPVVETVPFPSGTSLLLYTDGLIEGAPDKRLYRDRRLFKVANLEPHQSVNRLVEKVYEDWMEYLKGQTAQDDLCLMAIRAAS